MSALYMAVTADKYELPLLICDSAREISQKVGIAQNTVYHSIRMNLSRAKTASGEYIKIVKVEVNDESTYTDNPDFRAANGA